MDYKGRDNMEVLIEEMSKSRISTMPNILFGLLEVFKDPKANASHFVEAINKDQSIVVKLLEIANSPAFGMGKVSNLESAFILLGEDMVKELVFSLIVSKNLNFDGGYCDFSAAKLWENSLVVAASNKTICQVYLGDYDDCNYLDFYTAGLLKEFSLVMMRQFFYTKEFKSVISKRFLNKIDLHKIEKEYLGFTHEELGRKLAKIWNFPEDLSYIMGYHHTYQASDVFLSKHLDFLFHTSQVSQWMCYNINERMSERAIKFGYTHSDLKYIDTDVVSSLDFLNIDEVGISSLENILVSDVKKLEKANWLVVEK